MNVPIICVQIVTSSTLKDFTIEFSGYGVIVMVVHERITCDFERRNIYVANRSK